MGKYFVKPVGTLLLLVVPERDTPTNSYLIMHAMAPCIHDQMLSIKKYEIPDNAT